MKSLRPRALLLLLLSATALGCKTLSSDTPPGEPNYAKDAESNMQKGNEALESKNFADAEKYFEFVRTTYPFLEASKDAELRLADSKFEREQFAEARDAYQNFIKIHPLHPKVDYAAYRSALSHHREMPSELFILPPGYEKDQSDVKATLRAMNEFLRAYPKSQYAEPAKKNADEAKKRLAQHEMYVASFYKKRERWAAVASRLETLVESYPGVGFDEKALFGLHEAYSKLNDPEKAKGALKRLIERFPGTDAASKAQKLLGAS
jgi:outer membrane protein assembly factor BamD